MPRVTVGGDWPNRLAAAENPSSSATATKVFISASRSTDYYSNRNSDLSRARIVVDALRPHTAGMQPSQPIRLYRHPISGHSHRVELYLSLLGLRFELVHVELMKGQHKQPDFLALNRFGQV